MGEDKKGCPAGLEKCGRGAPWEVGRGRRGGHGTVKRAEEDQSGLQRWVDRARIVAETVWEAQRARRTRIAGEIKTGH